MKKQMIKKIKNWIKTCFLLLVGGGTMNGQVALKWVHQTGSAGVDQGCSVAIDDVGNIYTTGKFDGTVDFDPKDGVTNLIAPNGYGIFVQKLDAERNLLWAKSMGGTNSFNGGVGLAIAVDNWGNVYTVGYFSDTVDFDPNGGVHNLISTGNWDIFVQKLDSNGNFLWAKSMGGADTDEAISMVLDDLGNVYITGHFHGTVDFDPNGGVYNLTGSNPAFVQKLDSNGNFLWVKSMGSFLGTNEGKSITLDDLGNVYITGHFQGTVDFDPNGGVYNLSSVGSTDIFIQKLDNAGNFLWARSMGGNTTDYGYSIAVDNIGGVYTSGLFRETVDFDPGVGIYNLISTGDWDVFVQKLDSNGNFLWAKNMGGPKNDVGTSIALDDLNNIYITGQFQDTADFDPGVGITNLIATGNYDRFIQKLNSAGNFLWAKSIGANRFFMETSVALDNSNNIYLIGGFNGAVDFDPNEERSTLTGNWNMYLQKLIQKGIVGRLYHDYNQDCIQDINEIGLPNRALIINPGNIVVTTNNNGIWSVDSLPIGNYTISIDTSTNWLSTCPLIQNFTITNPDSIIVHPSLGFISTAPCSTPNVSIYAPFLRPGFSNQLIYIHVCNESTATGGIDSAYVIVQLDSLLTIQSGSLAYTDLGDNKYKINLDTLQPGRCVDITLNCLLSANAILSKTLCMTAKLYPVDTCSLDTAFRPSPPSITPCLTSYDGSHLVIRPTCNNDTISFVITNISDFDMTCYSQVRLFVDGQYILRDSVFLASGDTSMFVYLGDGKTWRMEVDQHPLHPGNSQPSGTIELCGNSANWTPNLVNILPLDDADPVVDIYCGLVTGSYDPNDKTGFPLGVGPTHDILPNQKIEYLIRFQNTGTDTAFTVVIRDTLSTDFDIFSLKSGASSHNYSFKMYGPRVLEWTFNNIMLPDSNVNEPASNGFVKFEVEQMPSLANGTVLENTAAIYFDFNAPIITNTSIHTINESISLFTTIQQVELEENLKIRFYPNPTNGIVYIDKKDNESLDFLVIDHLGRVLLSKKSVDPITDLDLSALPSGVYFVTVSNGSKMATQKIIKQ
ncbi:SBBP repeat-containing protein [Aureispira sp. CCB-E]|uniref:DUF7619 domain-containing protein n=1 Tax=Aureispira sp. CCB-E TaxID=3051121 RepID=UPI002868A2FB|nr:SBBP repeat-containing protein [Aureispira sp. CCB-E]WMX15899.1 SBBP repeat-containing protein [Aureispira sp. CCB-E]